MTKFPLADFLEQSCKSYVEKHILKLPAGVKLTKKEFSEYCRVQKNLVEEEELGLAVYILESAGYTVIPPKKKQ